MAMPERDADKDGLEPFANHQRQHVVRLRSGAIRTPSSACAG